MGVREILQEWIGLPRWSACAAAPTTTCRARKSGCTCCRALHAILLDIDKAIHIVRNTEEETEVVPNLMIGFGIDEVQAEYVAEIKLRHLNREYILKRTEEIEELEKDIARPGATFWQTPGPHPPHHHATSWPRWPKSTASPAAARSSTTLPDAEEDDAEEETVPDYPVHRVLHPGGLFQEDHRPRACA